MMERLRKGTEREIHNDVRDVQKNIALIRAPDGIRKKEQQADEVVKDVEMEDEEIEYMDAKEMEKKLSAGIMDFEKEEMLAN